MAHKGEPLQPSEAVKRLIDNFHAKQAADKARNDRLGIVLPPAPPRRGLPLDY